MDMLLNDFGYTGFRYDLVKGYAPMYTGLYNTSAKPEYSVGEYWDGTEQIKNWIDGTKADGVIQSAAFDFPLKYLLNDCCNSGSNWNTLAGSSLIQNSAYRRYAVTFIDNHDTNNRGNGNDLTANILAANAFILAAPGTPCIFLPHWKEYKADLKQERCVSESDASAFADRHGIDYLETSAFDGANIEETFIRLAKGIHDKVKKSEIRGNFQSNVAPLITTTTTRKQEEKDYGGCC